MIGAGIPLLEGFEILAEQVTEQNKGFGLDSQRLPRQFVGVQDCPRH